MTGLCYGAMNADELCMFVATTPYDALKKSLLRNSGSPIPFAFKVRFAGEGWMKYYVNPHRS